MEQLAIRFSNQLPYRIERWGNQFAYFLIPKEKRVAVLKFMEDQPEHILKKATSLWRVIGKPPDDLEQRGGRNEYRAYISGLKKVLAHIPHHELSKLSLPQLQAQPQVKSLYERYFKNNPGLLNPQSILNTLTSTLLNYDNDTGMVRESLADVRKKKQLPPSTVSSLEVVQENEFDRILLLVFSRFLGDNHIPELFLKSRYFTLRPRLLQVHQEDQVGFRARVEQARENIEREIIHDYRTLVNEVNRAFLARYPFEETAEAVGLDPTVRGFSAISDKLSKIKQLTLGIPGALQKFSGLVQLRQAYGSTPESSLISIEHVMRGLVDKMTDDEEFITAILKNHSPSFNKVLGILAGKSIS